MELIRRCRSRVTGGMRTISIRTRGALVALALAIPLAACGSSGSSSSTAAKSSAAAPAAGKLAVKISGYAFAPATATVAVGSRITFTNHDATAHTATSNQPAFDTGTVKPGQSATVTLGKPGTYTYYCQFHAFMHGTVIVR
jgi:plastocyanin